MDTGLFGEVLSQSTFKMLSFGYSIILLAFVLYVGLCMFKNRGNKALLGKYSLTLMPATTIQAALSLVGRGLSGDDGLMVVFSLFFIAVACFSMTLVIWRSNAT